MEARKKMTEWVLCHRGSRAMLPPCLRGFEIFSHGYFMGPRFFLVGISWVRHFFSWVFFVGPKFYLVGISWVQHFSRGFEIFSSGCSAVNS